ncbi:MAG: thiamine phosphate synthase [Euryarchaeota archaeon]|nr:thiamine phosphate synthase [Euryarchaeota archaeon]
MRSKHPWAFYFITDSNLTKQGFRKDSEDAIRGGARVMQYREKNKPLHDMAAEAKALMGLCKGSGIDLIINDSPGLARAVGASGVHIGPGDVPLSAAREVLPGGIIGVSCGTVQEVKRAEIGGADYIAASPVFFTSTKRDIGRPVGLEGLAMFREATDLPIVAIGGINLGNVREVVLAGADSVCAISATVGTPDVAASVREFEGRIKAALKERGR